MTKANKMQGKATVFISQLERFGYTLTAVGRTKREAENAVLSDYYSVYKDVNGIAPDEDWLDDEHTYWSLAKEEIFTEEVEFGKVRWL